MVKVEIAPGVVLWRERLDRAAQSAMLEAVFARVEQAPFYRPVMPKSGAPFSVEETNCCLVNLYRGGAKMGLHQDRDEAARAAPVLSVSLGDEALFRIGGETRKAGSASVKLSSGDVLTFGGVARMAYHGIDRVITGSSTLVPGGGRINLTLRRVTL